MLHTFYRKYQGETSLTLVQLQKYDYISTIDIFNSLYKVIPKLFFIHY